MNPPSSERAPAAVERAPFWAHPIGFWFIFWGELAERASFYGMRTILGTYMTDRLEFAQNTATTVVHLFIAAVYFLPLLGGYIADRHLGKYRTIVYFCLPYILGHVVMGVESRWMLVLALLLLAMGSGVTKPNISPLMGMTYDQQRPGQIKLRSDAFAMFYFAINVGAALSQWAIPEIKEKAGFSIAFLCPAALMVVAFGIFASGKRFYAKEEIRRTAATPEDRRQRWAVLKRLLGLFLAVAFFWSVFDQQSSTWVFLAKDYMDLRALGHEWTPEQLQFLNPAFLLLLLPLASVAWRVLARCGIHLRATDKMMIGFVLAVGTTVLMTLAGYRAAEGEKISVWWEIWAYVLLTAAEVCISPVGLELAFASAPESMKSFVTACWLVAVFGGNLLNSGIGLAYKRWLAPGPFFAIQLATMVVVGVAFLVIARQFNRVAHVD